MNNIEEILKDWGAADEALQKQVDELKARVEALEAAATSTTSGTE